MAKLFSDSHPGTALKSTSGWNSANGANNYSFTGLHRGTHSNYNGGFNSFGGYFWISTSYNLSNAWIRDLSHTSVTRSYDYIVAGFSVRCLKD